MTLQEIHDNKLTAIQALRDLSAEAENREYTADEQTRASAIEGDIDRWGSIYEREEKLAKEERLAALTGDELRASTGLIAAQGTPAGDPPAGPASPATPTSRAVEEAGPERRAFSSLLANGVMDAQDIRDLEGRALQADSLVAGGYLLAPEQFMAELIQAVDDEVFMRRLGTVLPPLTESGTLGAPSLDADPADADWTSELLTGSADSTMTIGKRNLTPHPIAKRILVSNKLLRMGPLSAETIVRARLAYKFGITQEKGFMTGNGAEQLLGVFSAAPEGISTGRDVNTGNSTTAFTVDGLIECKYSIKGAYYPRLQWVFHRDSVKMLAKLKDGEGQYIWSESPRVGEPAQLLGFPMNVSEYAPNTFTTGLYVGILGDFSQYWIVDSLVMTVQRLVELYAATNQTGFIARAEVDGMPVLEEAFSRVTLT